MATRWVGRTLTGLDRLVQVLCIACMAIVVVSVTWQVVSRYVTRESASWTAELAGYAFVWLAMLAIALGVRQGRHMVLDIWEYVPQRRWLRVLVTTVASALVLATLVALVWFGVEALPSAFRRTSPGTGIAFGWVALAVPVGCAVSAIFGVEAWWRMIRNPDPDRDPLPSEVLFQSGDEHVVKGEI